jgi:hypothetical protein
MNQKDQRIRKLWEKGHRSISAIARKIGYGGAMNDGIKRVEEGLERLGIKNIEGNPPDFLPHEDA